MATSSNSQPPAPSPSAGFSSLHYGGSANPRSGSLSNKPQVKRQFRVHLRHEQAAGFTAGQIAPMLRISVPRIKQILRSPEYLIDRLKITHGIILDQDAQLAKIKEQRKEMLVQLLPAALQTIANELQRAPSPLLSERKHQTALALELLDREGTFAKVSRTEIKPVDAFDFEEKDAVSRSILSVIRGVAPPPALLSGTGEHSDEAVRANSEFSNSHTLSAMDQQAALKTLEDAEQTSEMSPELLELVPPATESVN